MRGVKGKEILIRDARGRIRGRFENGARDIAPISGKDLKLSLDIKLQEYAESLMVNKIGAVVAIEPSTGEILSMTNTNRCSIVPLWAHIPPVPLSNHRKV